MGLPHSLERSQKRSPPKQQQQSLFMSFFFLVGHSFSHTYINTPFEISGLRSFLSGIIKFQFHAEKNPDLFSAFSHSIFRMQPRISLISVTYRPKSVFRLVFFLQPIPPGRSSPASQGSPAERPSLRLGYRSLSSSSMKGHSTSRDEGNSPEQASLPEHTPSARTNGRDSPSESPRPQRWASHKGARNDTNLVSSNESLEERGSASHRKHRDPTTGNEDAPSVSSGYNSDDLNSSAHEPTSPGVRSGRSPGGQPYDPKQYQDQHNDFHAVGFESFLQRISGAGVDPLSDATLGLVVGSYSDLC